MFNKKNKKILEQKIDWLIKILEEGNLKELVYILGNKKEIIFRNVLARNWKRCGNWYRNHFNFSHFSLCFAKDCGFKYSCYWRIYSRYCRNCREKQIIHETETINNVKIV